MIESTNQKCDLFSEVLSSALADNTKIAYEKGWNYFSNWCEKAGVEPLSATADEMANFFFESATQPSIHSETVLSIGTMILYRSAINHKYVEAGIISPTNHPFVKATIRGLVRVRGSSHRQVLALREFHIEQMLSYCDESLIGLRNAAIISLGFAGALRRSEICGLTVNDFEIFECLDKKAKHMILYIRKSKTDQEGKGQKIAIPNGEKLKPITRLQDWLTASEIVDGHLFQTMRRGGYLRGKPMHHSDIPRLVKHYANLIGLDPTNVSGHSLRAGFVTSAAVHNARLDKIMEVTRHTNPSTVMKYIRDANSFNDHAGQNFL